MALNGMPVTDAVGKLPTDADGNNAPYKKDKLDCSIGSRSMYVIENNDVGTTKVYCLVAKSLNMSPDLNDCSISH